MIKKINLKTSNDIQLKLILLFLMILDYYSNFNDFLRF